jgi:hypothetical protein
MTIADANSRTVWAGEAVFSLSEAAARALVLLHGIGSAAASFRYQLDAV